MKCLVPLLAALSLGLGGCANFQAITEFAQATKQVAAPIRDEMTFITATCVRQAELRSAFELDDEFERIAQCRGTDQVLQALQRETVNVMELYASALLALVDNRKPDLSGDIEKATKKLAALKSADGSKVVSDTHAGALQRALTLVADAWLQREREQGIRQLVTAAPQLADVGRTLNLFFQAETGQAPYVELVRLTQAEARAVDTVLRSDLVLRADPLRAAELRLAQWKVRKALRERTRAGPDTLRQQLSQSLQAWVDSIPDFAEQAFKPEPAALRERIKALRAHVAALSAAMEPSP
jgi:hypothetical protein